MKLSNSRGLPAALIASALVATASGAFAQGLVSTAGVIVAKDGDTVPDATGAPTLFTFGGSGGLSDNSVLDESGNILFRGRFIDSPFTLTPINERAYFYGSSRATLKMVVRGGDQAPPTLSTGVLLRTATGSTSALSAAVRLAPNGTLWWGSTFMDSLGTAVPPVTSANDEAVFGGPFGSQTMLLRQGDFAPGTALATFAQAFSSPSAQSTGINRNGDCFFQGTLTGGDVVGTTNQSGIWAGPPSSLTLVQRKGTACDGLPGLFISSTSSSALGFMFNMNSAGQLLYEVNLDLTVGAPLPVAADDHCILLYTPGSGSQVFVREGQTVPGPSLCTFNAATGDSWSQGVSANFLTRSGRFIFSSTLRGGDVSGTLNDTALFEGTVGSLAMVVRKNDAAPGTDATFSGFSNTTLVHSDSGRIAFNAFLTGGTSTTTNDTGIWAGLPGSLALVVREGQVMSTGGTVGNLNGGTVMMNDQNRVIFSCTLTGGTNPGNSLWLWDPATGLTPLVLLGDLVEGSAVTGFGLILTSNTDGAPMSFGHDGTLAVRVQLSVGSAHMILKLPNTNPLAFCTNDSIGIDHTTPCPCGNTGLAGNGCGHSFDPNGANMSATGTPALDDVVLHSQFEPASSFTLMMQHENAGDSVFHDGVLCAGNPLIRLRGRAAVAGEAFFPNSNFAQDSTTTLSIRGAVTVGSGATRYYAGWYRNASSTFCPPATANVTNGLRIIW